MRAKQWRVLLVLIAMIGALLAVAGSGADAAGHSAVARVFWTDRNAATVSVTDVASGVTKQLVAPTGGRLQDVDLDAAAGVLYFADWGPVGFPGSQGTINQVNTDGTGLAPVCGPGTLGDAVHQLALDPVAQQIYFTRGVSYDNHEVSRVNYGPGCAGYTVSFLAGGGGGPGWFPSGLAHDPVNDILYWGDIGVLFLPPNGSVNQMTASTLAVGPLPTQLTPHVTGRGRGFALEPVSSTIFLTSHNPLSPGTGGAVFAYDIALGTETQIIPAVGQDPDTGYWDIEIDPIGQRIWYTAPGAGEIRSANFDGSDVQVELSDLGTPYGLALQLNTPPEAFCNETVNPHGKTVPPAGSSTLPGPKGGQNEDGFYEVSADDADGPDPLEVWVEDTGSGMIFGPFPSGTKIKYTEANGATPSIMPMGGNNGSGNGQANAVDWHIRGTGDAAAFAVDGLGAVSPQVSCLVPPPPK